MLYIYELINLFLCCLLADVHCPWLMQKLPKTSHLTSYAEPTICIKTAMAVVKQRGRLLILDRQLEFIPGVIREWDPFILRIHKYDTLT